MADVTPQSILFGLPKLRWRNIPSPPYDIAPVSVTHRQAPRIWPYVEGVGHDNTGRDALVMACKFHFVNTLQDDAFPALFNKWREALLDGSQGKLLHPIMGFVNARVMSFDIQADANVTVAGVHVNVVWHDTIEDPATATTFEPISISATALAKATDEALSELGIPFPEGGPSELAGPFEQIDGFITQSTNTVSGAITQVQGTITKIVDTIEKADDFANGGALDLLKQLYAASLDINNRLGAVAARATNVTVFPNATTLTAVAKLTGNSLLELMSLNLELLGKPDIAAGASVKVYS